MNNKKKRPLRKRILGIVLLLLSIIIVGINLYLGGYFGYWILSNIFPFM